MWFDFFNFVISFFFQALCTNPRGFATSGVRGGGVSILLLLPLIVSDRHPNNQTHINTLLWERLQTPRADGDFNLHALFWLWETERSVVTEQLRDIPAQMQRKKLTWPWKSGWCSDLDLKRIVIVERCAWNTLKTWMWRTRNFYSIFYMAGIVGFLFFHFLRWILWWYGSRFKVICVTAVCFVVVVIWWICI